MKKKWIPAVIAAVVVIVLTVIPSLINVNSYRPEIESRISAALGRQVSVGNLSLSVFAGSVQADNISVVDDPVLSKSAFVQAKQLKVGVQIWPLMTSHQINITSLTLQQPEVNLIQDS